MLKCLPLILPSSYRHWSGYVFISNYYRIPRTIVIIATICYCWAFYFYTFSPQKITKYFITKA